MSRWSMPALVRLGVAFALVVSAGALAQEGLEGNSCYGVPVIGGLGTTLTEGGELGAGPMGFYEWRFPGAPQFSLALSALRTGRFHPKGPSDYPVEI